MPVFRFFKNKAKIDEVLGGNQGAALEAKIKQHGGASGNSSSTSTSEHESPISGFVSNDIS